jgi:hypothetical protein
VSPQGDEASAEKLSVCGGLTHGNGTSDAGLVGAGAPSRRYGENAALDQELPASAASGPQPALVEPKQVLVGRAGRSLADLRQDVDERRELLGELPEHWREGISLGPTQYAIRRPADADVVINVHQAPLERVGKKSGQKE